jgi:hypothetical protein
MKIGAGGEVMCVQSHGFGGWYYMWWDKIGQAFFVEKLNSFRRFNSDSAEIKRQLTTQMSQMDPMLGQANQLLQYI